MEIFLENNIADKKFLLCVSGGVDSMVMLHLFCKQVSKTQFAVVTVNHNLREEGASDADFVEDFCQKQGVKCFKTSVDVKSYCTQSKLSVETAARILRYQQIEKVFVDGGFDFACLAHHADDNAETVLLHLLRGGGLKGACGIKRVQGNFFRPMLSFCKQEILEYAKREGVDFVEDKTNAETDCSRNFLRNNIFPLLKQINPQAVKNLNNFAAICTEEDKYLDEVASTAEVVFDKDKAVAPTKLFLQPKPIAIRIIYKIMRKLGIFKDIENSHQRAILQLCQNTNGTKQLSLPFGFEVVRSYDKVIFQKQNMQQKSVQQANFALGSFCLNGVQFVAQKADDDFLSDKQTKIQFEGLAGGAKTAKKLFLDLDKIPDTAVFRFREEGDIFCKYGGGSKKLKDFFIDKKIPKSDRDNIPLLCDGKTVLAVLGVEISEYVKVQSNSCVIELYIDNK